MSNNVWLSGMASILLGVGVGWAEDKPEPAKPESGRVVFYDLEPMRLEVQAEAKAAPGQGVEFTRKVRLNGQPVENPADGAQQPVRLGEYWLGVAVARPDEALRDKLQLPADQGLVVKNVVPDSPAEKAGIKEDDVLLKVGDKALKQIQDLVDVVNQSKEKELTIELLHDGQQEKVTVTPTKRPGERRFPIGTTGNADWDKIMQWFGQMQGGEGQPPFKFRVLRPGTILPPSVGLQHALPDDMTVTISKTGRKPAQITVHQGEKSWEATIENLDKLPEKVRPEVERLLGRAPFNIKIYEPNETPPPAEPPQWRERAMPPQPGSRLEKRLDEMSQQIDKLNRMMDELREQRKQSRPPQKPAPQESEEAPQGPQRL